ncbi:MAG: BatD family protein [Candidatus Cloacimonadota bacterium]|nr:BatD family protein [Candidatus Cloacimonadota bacterium]
MKRVILLFLISLTCYSLFSLEVTSYVNKNKIGLQDILKFTIEITGENANDVNKPNLPNLEDFTNLGSSSSTSSSYSIINGKMQSSFTQKYTYNLRPQKAGNITLPSISFNFKGKQYSTNPIKITVVEGSTEPAPPFSSSNNEYSSDKLEDNLFIQAKVNKKTVYVSEPVILTYKIYTRYNIENMSYAEEPTFNYFWKEDIFNATSSNFSTTTLNGVRYNEMLLREIALFPSKTGQMKIEPLAMDIDIYISGQSFFDFGRTKRYRIASKPIVLEVKPLPENSKPHNFTGAVGTFNIKSSISKNEIQTGNSLTYTLEISGEGNLRQFKAPQLPKVKNLRYLDPEITTDINDDQISGKKILKYLIIGQEKGDFTVPSLEFSYFDVEKKKYQILTTAPYNIKVTQGSKTSPIGTSFAQTNVQMEGRDIAFIKDNFELTSYQPIYHKFLYWFFWILLLLTIPIAKLYAKENYQLQSNQYYQRQKRANKILKKYLKEAREHAREENSEFYYSAHVGLSNYLVDKLKIPRGSSTDYILKKMEKKIPNKIVKQTEEFFEQCNKARFMPGGFSPTNIRNDLDKLKNILAEISKKMR